MGENCTSTTVKIALAPQWKIPDRKIANGRQGKQNAEKITTKHNEPQHPYFEEVLPRLGSQNCGRTTCLQGKTALL